jgi:hypothetical protein
LRRTCLQHEVIDEKIGLFGLLVEKGVECNKGVYLRGGVRICLMHEYLASLLKKVLGSTTLWYMSQVRTGKTVPKGHLRSKRGKFLELKGL